MHDTTLQRDTIKLQERKLGESLQDIRVGQDILKRRLDQRQLKQKNRQIGLH